MIEILLIWLMALAASNQPGATLIDASAYPPGFSHITDVSVPKGVCLLSLPARCSP